VAGEVDHRAAAVLGHAGDVRVVRPQHGRASRGDGRHQRTFDVGELLQGVDVGDAQVIPLADVGDDSYVAAVEAQPGTENTTTRRLQHRRLDAWVLQHPAGAGRPAAVPRGDAPAGHVNPLGTGHANAVAGQLEQVCRQPGRGRLAIDSGDA